MFRSRQHALALLLLGEARVQRAFLIKQHDYREGVLTDGAVPGTGRASSWATLHHLTKGGGVVPTTAASSRTEQTWRRASATLGGTLEQPRMTDKPQEDPGAPAVP